ncbi:MAG: TrkA family potassium uptake protein [Spirochaetales bacterium]|nr:MAG: TrkA family potassium uptake protein [Spirochaetales bacterium]
MIRQYAVIGLGSFGLRVLQKLAEATDQIIIVDRDKAVVESCKELAAKSYITDAINPEALTRILPEGIDVSIVDVGGNLEAAIVITNTLKKLGVRQIIVRADSDERGEILKIVGATTIIYPAREAAEKLVPLLVSPTLFRFMPISPSLVLAEVKVPERYVGLTLIEANFRQARGINVVALRKEDGDEYIYFEPKYRMQADDVLLCAGSEEDVTGFTGTRVTGRKIGIGNMLKGIFGRPRFRKETSSEKKK